MRKAVMRPVYIGHIKDFVCLSLYSICGDSSAVECLSYTQMVGGSNPSLRTTNVQKIFLILVRMYELRHAY